MYLTVRGDIDKINPIATQLKCAHGARQRSQIQLVDEEGKPTGVYALKFDLSDAEGSVWAKARGVKYKMGEEVIYDLR